MVGKAIGANRRRMCVLAYRNLILEIQTSINCKLTVASSRLTPVALRASTLRRKAPPVLASKFHLVWSPRVRMSGIWSPNTLVHSDHTRAKVVSPPLDYSKRISFPSYSFYLPRSGKVMQNCRSKINQEKGLMDFETLKPLFLVIFGIILSSFEPV